MGQRSKQVDAYVAKAPDWARPILTAVRDAVHAASDDIDEAIKWSRPAFMYRGKILAGMSAFKQHCAFYFFNGALVVADRFGGADGAAGQFGRLTSVKDVPSKKTVAQLVKKATALIDGGAPAMKRAPARRKPALTVPDYLTAALKKNRKALATFEAFPPSHKREYVEWITDAKGEDTRQRRLAQALEWMAEGKPRNWKYMR